MSKIANDGLTRSGTGCFIAVPIRQQWASKGYILPALVKWSTSDCRPVHYTVHSRRTALAIATLV